MSEDAKAVVAQLCSTIWATHGLPSEGNLAIIEDAIAAAIASEREACAQLADAHADDSNDVAEAIAAGIRARGGGK